jgi:hypothetical protein
LGGGGSCGSLVGELLESDGEVLAELAVGYDRRRRTLRAGLVHRIDSATDPRCGVRFTVNLKAVGMPITKTEARQELERVAARRRLDEREMYRAIHQAVQARFSQRQISEIVGTLSQATVQRIIQRIAATPALLRETPSEIIDRRAAGLIDGHVMMDGLLNWKYSFGAVPRIDDVVTDGYRAGDWDEIESAYYRNLLSDSEFAELFRHHQAMIGRAVRAT